MRRAAAASAAAAVVIFFFAATVFSASPARAIEVRVLVADGLRRLDVSAAAPLVLRDDAGEALAAGAGVVTITARGERVEIGPVAAAGRVFVEAEESAPVRAAGRRWRGRLLVEARGGRLRVLNAIDLEDYLRGVVPLESPHDWPAEALRAQAIAARTYALARALDTAVPYLRRGVADQVYGGADAERPAADAAVAATAGEILLWEGRPFVSYFHACCGGHTDAPSDALGRNAPPLHGVPDTYCLDSPYASWTATVRGSLRVLRVSPGGRIVETEWAGKRRGGNEFRLAAGATRVRSTRAVPEPIRGGTRLRGRGWGHGAGLCQWGARGRAAAGFGHEEILLHYYPGATIGTYEDLRHYGGGR